MRSLRQRRISFTRPAEPRTRRLMVIRWVYLSSIFILAVWLANFFFGEMLYLRSEGLVVGQPSVVAAEFPVTVRDLLVREGEHVKAGQVAAVVTSQEVLETIARLSADIAARQVRLGELRIRDQTIDAMLALAEDRDKVATSARKEFERLVQQGYQSLDKRTAAIESEYRSRQDLETLKAEKRSVDEELKILGTVLGEAQSALHDLRRNYDEGRLRVSIDGIVSRLSVDKGAVVRAGEPLIEIYGLPHYVLAYLPTGGLYTVVAGDPVEISSGLRTMRGTIVRVEPFAAALPREFQRSFIPVERQQVIRVEFASGVELPPLFTKVQIRSPNVARQWVATMWEKSRRLLSGATSNSRFSTLARSRSLMPLRAAGSVRAQRTYAECLDVFRRGDGPDERLL
jgi:multidrug resistance efflux pump